MGIVKRHATEEFVAIKEDKINQEINHVKNGEVPEYWMSHLDNKVDLIWKAMELAGRNKSAFFFYSDAHWWAKDRNDAGVTWEHSYTTKTEPVLLKYLYKNTPINKTNFGGDFIGEEADITTANGRTTMAYIHEWRKMLRDIPNHHSVPGNHDDGNEVNNRFTEDFVWSYLMAPEEEPYITYGEGFYYYLDNQAEKTRYLYLDTAYKGLDGIQAEFVKQALLSTPSKWHIVAIAHKWYDTDYTTNPASTGALSANGSTLLSMFDNYNARSGEYASCEGWVEFCIGGHTHWDYDGASDNGIPVILVESSSINDRSGFNPAPGTTTETAISAIIADYDNQKINVIRIGRGTNREVTIGNFIISYVNLLPISLDTSGNIFNNIGYKTESRISGSSGTADATGCCASGYMPCEKLDVVRLENITMSGENGSGHVMIAFYNAIEDAIAVSVNITDIKQSGNQCEPVFDGDNLIQFTVPNYPEINDGQVYFRICADVIDNASIVTIGEVILEKEEDNDTYTNVLLTAVDSDGSAIDGGYKESNRISGSSGFSGVTGCDATGWIACNKGDVIRFYNMTFDLSGGTTHPSIALYAAVQLSTHGVYNYSTLTASDNVWNTVLDGSNIVQVTIPDYSELTSPIYFRVCADDINENTIITINKEI